MKKINIAVRLDLNQDAVFWYKATHIPKVGDLITFRKSVYKVTNIVHIVYADFDDVGTTLLVREITNE